MKVRTSTNRTSTSVPNVGSLNIELTWKTINYKEQKLLFTDSKFKNPVLTERKQRLKIRKCLLGSMKN